MSTHPTKAMPKKSKKKYKRPSRAKPAPKKRRYQPDLEKCNAELTGQMATLIMAGHAPTPTAAYCGISDKSHRKWMARGEAEKDRLEADPATDIDEHEEKYLNHFLVISKAIGFSEIRALDILQGRTRKGEDEDGNPIIIMPTPEDRKWSAWWLERSKRERWSQSHDINMHGPDNGPIEINTSADERLRRLEPGDIKTIAAILIRLDLEEGDTTPGGDTGPESLPETGLEVSRPG